jgi:hypothetical protein
LIQSRDQAVDPADLPETADSVDTGDEPETVVLETVRCGDDPCHCSDSDDDRHGPSLYRYQSDGESLNSAYLGNLEDHAVVSGFYYHGTVFGVYGERPARVFQHPGASTY